MPRAGWPICFPSATSSSAAPRKRVRVSSNSEGWVTIGTMTFRGASAAAWRIARSCTLKSSLLRSERRTPRIPRKGFDSPSRVIPGKGLSPPASNVRIVTERPAAQLKI